MSALALLRAWWWPAFLFVYPLLAWPLNAPNRAGAAELHWWITGVALLGGLLLEVTAPRLPAAPGFLAWLRARPALLLALVFGGWCLLTALFAPDIGAAYLGGAYDKADGALWAAAMVAVFLLVARAYSREPGQAERLARALVLAVSLVSLGALVEVSGVLAQFHASGSPGIFYSYIPADMPLVSFPQKGHLAGLLVMGAAAAVALSGWWRWLALLPAVALGLTVNRAGWLALAVVLLLLLWRERRRWPLALAVAVAVAAGWGLVNQQNASRGVSTKQALNEGSLASRTYFWRSALRGILARPITGWGGGQYYLHWGDYLTLPELKTYIRLELGEKLNSYTPGQPNPFHTCKPLNPADVENSPCDPKVQPLNRYYTAWKAHNELLEQGLMHGLVGLALYLVLLVLTLLNLRRAPLPAYLALVGYQVFLLLWFVIPESDGLLWSMWALAGSEAAVRRPLPEAVSPAPSGPPALG